MNMKHISEDDLELYAVGALSELVAERLEEHLLGCSKCQERLETMDEYVRAMRMAAERIGRDERGRAVDHVTRSVRFPAEGGRSAHD